MVGTKSAENWGVKRKGEGKKERTGILVEKRTFLRHQILLIRCQRFAARRSREIELKFPSLKLSLSLSLSLSYSIEFLHAFV